MWWYHRTSSPTGPLPKKSVVWKNSQVTEPPILADYSDQQIMEFVEQPLVLDIPSNTHFVERLIRVITQKGTEAADPKIRDGLVRVTLNRNAPT